MRDLLKLLRPKHWIKNMFVFLPLFFSGNIANIEYLSESVVAFVIFSLVSGSIYIFNDYFDIEADREHPEKKRRPLASGAVSIFSAMVLFWAILVVCIALIFLIQYIYEVNTLEFSLVVLAYFTFNMLYTIKLKHIAIVDVFIIAIGFVLRVLAGGFLSDIYVSQWTILLTFALALVLAVGKRRQELVVSKENENKTRKALDGYNIQFTDIALAICCTLAIICYIMFTLSPEVQQKFHTHVYYTVFFVIFGFLRYLQQTLVYNKAESPTMIVYKDRYIQITLILWFTAFLLQIYIK